MRSLRYDNRVEKIGSSREASRFDCSVAVSHALRRDHRSRPRWLHLLLESSAERIFGYLRGDAIGSSLDLIIPERLRQRHWDGYRATIATGRSRYGEGDLLPVP